jgi:hypothetical protein
MSTARSGVDTIAKKERLHLMEARTGHVLSIVPTSMPSAARRPGARNAT